VTVVAEKLCTAISLGDMNTRDRDYADLYRIISCNDFRGSDLDTALAATAAHCGITLQHLGSAISDLAERRQHSYSAWRRRQGPDLIHYPESFTDVIGLVLVFADPLIAGEVSSQHWAAATGWTQ
jgi:hypothetical protein